MNQKKRMKLQDLNVQSFMTSSDRQWVAGGAQTNVCPHPTLHPWTGCKGCLEIISLNSPCP